jgi:voltage-gated potassium channel
VGEFAERPASGAVEPLPSFVSNERRLRWENGTDVPLLAGAVLFLAAYAWPILDPQLPSWAAWLCSVTSWTVWVLFAADFGVRLTLAEQRWHFLRRNWLDVLTLAVPMLRPLRALRVVVALNILGRRGGHLVRGRVVAYVAGAVAVSGFVAALAVIDAERTNPEANIRTFSDAAWWAAATVTTVGYGDRYPTTGEGRLVALGLMLTGIALLGVVTAAIASWFVERLADAQATDARTEAEVTDLAAEVHTLREEIAALRHASATTRPGRRRAIVVRSVRRAR